MNNVELQGYIQNIKHSHNAGIISYSQCELIQGDNLIQLLFKEGLTSKLQEGMEVSLKGNLRTHSSNSHNIMYVNTYFDEGQHENLVQLDGIIIKTENLYTYANGKCNVHLILKNNLEMNSNSVCTNNIPCVARNEMAKLLSQLNVGDKISITGTLKCRTYQKKQDDEVVIKVTHEVEVTNFEVVE